MGVPELSHEQKQEALRKAQLMRTQRSQLRQQLKAGLVDLREIFSLVDDEVVGKMRIRYLLESLPNVGKITAERIMEEIGINAARRLQGLGPRQREALLEKLG
ncbi:MAG: integration host factor, actinobacterial type [Clostridia bacterium]|nr:integration host factor, actinobacterial type [Clostridia bacterium]